MSDRDKVEKGAVKELLRSHCLDWITRWKGRLGEFAGYGIDFPKACAAIDALEPVTLSPIGQEGPGPDRMFIDHIRGHLHPGEEVICKICGLTAEEIIASYTPQAKPKTEVKDEKVD